jgi:hypothetical protein
VSSRAAYANLLLPRLLRERDLDQRDSAFATQLAYGTLRAQGTLDTVLARLVPRAGEDDVAVVAVRVYPEDRPRPAEAGPNRGPPTVPPDPA